MNVMEKGLFDGCLEVGSVREAEAVGELMRSLPACKGVICFADHIDRSIQLMITGDIRRAARVRLLAGSHADDRKRSADISQIVAKVYYSCGYNDFRSSLNCLRIARAIYPDSYTEAVRLPRQSYIKVDMTAKWPVFRLTQRLDVSGGHRVFGPFVSRRSATEFIQILQDAFDLCRMPSLLEHGKANVSCPYLQMDQCCGVCVGKVGDDEYRRQVERAIAAACGDTSTQTQELQDRMGRLAKEREFEKAEAARKAIEQLAKLDKDSYCWVTDLEKLAILHIDRSAKVKVEGKRKKTQMYSAFVVRAGEIFELADFELEQVEGFYQVFTELIAKPVKPNSVINPVENLSLVSYFLYKNNPAGVWINCSAGKGAIPAAERIVTLLSESCS